MNSRFLMATPRLARRLALSVALLSAACAPAFVASTAQAAPAPAPAQALPSHVAGQVLVRFKPSASASARAELLARVGGTVTRTFSTGWAQVQVGSTQGALAVLEGSGLVEAAQPNFRLQAAQPTAASPIAPSAERIAAAGAPNDPYYPLQWALQKIEAPRAWKVTTGSDDVIVAVMELGMPVDLPDLAPNVWTNAGEIPGNGIDDDKNGYVDDVHGWNAYDGNGTLNAASHSAHVAGIIGARGNNRLGTAGVNWRVKMISVEVIPPGNIYDSAAVIAGVDYLLALKRQGVNVRAVNCSFGYADQTFRAESDSFQALGRAGVLIVKSAGNGAVNLNNYPNPLIDQRIPNFLAVGATDVSDGRAWFSDYGVGKVDIFAPGGAVYSSINEAPSAIASYYGTSMAAPHITGAAALLWASQPQLTAQQVKQRLLASASHLAQLRGSVQDGRRLNLGALLENEVHTIRGQVKAPVGTGSTGLAGVPVFLDGHTTPDAVTDASGVYVITGVAGGAHRVRASLTSPNPSGLSFAPVVVSLPAGRAAAPTVARADITATQAIAKRYTLLVSVQEDGPDFSEKPRANVDIYLNGSPNPIARTDAEGQARIPNLPASTYAIRVVDPAIGETLPDTEFVSLPDPNPEYKDSLTAEVYFYFLAQGDRTPPLIKATTRYSAQPYTKANAPRFFAGTVTDATGVDYLYANLLRINNGRFEYYNPATRTWSEQSARLSIISGKSFTNPKSFQWKVAIPQSSLDAGYTYGLLVNGIDVLGNYTIGSRASKIVGLFKVAPDSVPAT